MPDWSETYSNDFRRLADPDENLAREAFSRLWEATVDRLKRRVRRYGLSEQICEDIAQTTGVRLWNGRLNCDIPNGGAWWSLVCQVAKNLAIDHRRKHRVVPSELPEGDIPDGDWPYIHNVFVYSRQYDMLVELADRVWLGAMESGVDPKLAVLAAQYFYLHGTDVTTIASMLGIPNVGDLERWLTSTPVLLRMAFRELAWENDKLAGRVLSNGKPYRSRELDELMRRAYANQEPPPDGWAWEEILVAMWHIRNGLVDDRILSQDRCHLGESDLQEFLKRLSERYPFSEAAMRLTHLLRSSATAGCLRKKEIWRRVAFQYFYLQRLPYAHILERAAPPAAILGNPLTHSTLTGWIGGNRLVTQLAAATEGM
jgi:DNA-directed RNA polymerase specialized sigma24 family protein